MLTAFFKDSAIYTALSIVSRGLSILLLPLYVRVLSPSDFGSLDLLVVFGQLIKLTVALEVTQGVARYFGCESDPTRKMLYASTAFWFTLCCYTVFGLLSFGSSSALSTLVMGKAGLEVEFQIGLLYVWLSGILLLLHCQFRWELRSMRYAVGNLVEAFSAAGMVVILTCWFGLGLKGLLWSMVFGAAAGVCHGLWHLRDSIRFCFDLGQLKEMLAFSVPLVPSGIAVFVIAYVDRLMIARFLTMNDVGIYGIAFRLASAVGLIMAGFQGAMMPLVYKHHQEIDTPYQLARIMRIFLAFALQMCLFLVLFSREILGLIATPDYYGASKILIFLAPAILLSQMYIFAPGLSLAKKTHLFLLVNLMGAVTNAILNWWLIPRLGIAGAALASFFSYGCVFCAYMILSQKLYPVPHRWSPLAASVVFTAVLGWGVPLLDLEGIGRFVLNGMVLFAAGAFMVYAGLINVAEIRQAREFALSTLTLRAGKKTQA